MENSPKETPEKTEKTEKKVVLIVAPHADDEVLGCGGVIQKHVAQGDEVTVIVVSDRVYLHQVSLEDVENERGCFRRAQGFLGFQHGRLLGLVDERVELSKAIQRLEYALEDMKLEPDLVYIPSEKDLNQDHQVVSHACRIVFRSITHPKLQRVLEYEVIGSTAIDCGWNVFEELSREHVALKVRALEMYPREIRDAPHPRSGQGITALASHRGMLVGVLYAEAFRLVWERGRLG